MIPPASAYRVTRITGVEHHAKLQSNSRMQRKKKKKISETPVGFVEVYLGKKFGYIPIMKNNGITFLQYFLIKFLASIYIHYGTHHPLKNRRIVFILTFLYISIRASPSDLHFL